jgi:tRNA 2-selenouridine synthase
LIISLDLSAFLQQSKGFLLLDVRSEGEYLHAHIPGAINLPLFTNAERAEVGILYKKKSRNDAIQRGLEIVGPKIAGFTAFVSGKIMSGKVFVYCWRGGMRSGSMAWLLNLMGWQVYTLKSGYKSFRTEVQVQLAKPGKFIALAGKTGCGKTDILHALQLQGQQVIDLEALANHKGSAFGALGQAPQPTTEMFENLLYGQLKQTDYTRNIWIENESKGIGLVYMNHAFWLNVVNAVVYVIDLDLNARIGKLTAEYGSLGKTELADAVKKIEKRLGGANCKAAVEAIEAGVIKTAVAIALLYYDKAYTKSEDMKQRQIKGLVAMSQYDPEKAAAQLIEMENTIK